MSESKPVFEYLKSCSQPSLESFELSRLNRARNLRREMRELVEEWIEAEVQARLARWVLEHRRARDRALIPFPDSLAKSPEELRPGHHALPRAGKSAFHAPTPRPRKVADAC